ncbi:MAG: hypothetical protein JWR54_3069 [Mucilaginibacter sp.]|nr:hypothetical protein [Mucilaginibacter sp.]
MRIYLFLLLFLFINHSATSQVKNSNNGPHITIKIIKPVNGYKISILWYPIEKNPMDEIFGPATMELTRINDNRKFTVNYESFSIDCRIKDLIIKDDLVKSYSNTVVSLSYNAIKDKPFYFFDINFDGVKELIIAEGLKKGVLKKNEIFDITSGNKITPINYEPFDGVMGFNIENGRAGFYNEEIDVKKKEIIVTDVFGCCQSTDKIYRLNNDQTSPNKNKFVVIRTEENDYQSKKGFDIMTIHIPGKKDQTKIVKL